MFLLISQLDETIRSLDISLKKLRKEIELWEEDPPLWAARLRRSPSTASFGQAEHWNEYESRMENRWKQVLQRISELEEKVGKIAYDMKKEYVDNDTYESDTSRRQNEIRKLQENVKSANGFLKGVMAMLNYQDDENPSDPPPSYSPPRRSKP